MNDVFRVSQRARSLVFGRRGLRGFTLLELMVAMAVMAVMALMSWHGVDGMVRTVERVGERVNNVQRLQTGLAQWTADLDGAVETGLVNAMEFDGRVLRLTRLDSTAPDSPWRVVGWARRSVVGQLQGLPSWARWQSGPLRTQGEVVDAWRDAGRWASSPAGSWPGEVAIVGLAEWNLVYFRNNAWTHPQSAADADSKDKPSPGGQALTPPPEGIRLTLMLEAGQAFEGVMTRDWVRLISRSGM